jgi:hypothetical protein
MKYWSVKHLGILMKTKLFSFLLIVLLFFPQANAQKRRKADTGVHIGILGGCSLQTFIGKDYWGEKLDNKFVPGFHGGGNVILHIGPDLYLQPGLLFTIKGAKQNIITDNIAKTVSLSYVEVPLNVLFRPQLGDGHILLGLGPYAAYGIKGNERTKSGTITIEIPVKYLADAAEEPTTYVYYRGPDAGANIFIGYEFYNQIFCQLNAQMGFLKINSDYGLPNDNTLKKNLGFGLSAGYRF